jgi:hypothetical protein
MRREKGVLVAVRSVQRCDRCGKTFRPISRSWRTAASFMVRVISHAERSAVLMTEVFLFIDAAHADTTGEPWPDDDPGIPTFDTAELAKTHATEVVNRQLAEAGEPPIEIAWTETESGLFPMNLDDEKVSYFQVIRAQKG